MIKVENLSKTFKKHSKKADTLRYLFTHFFNQGALKKFKALDNVNFEVESGDFVGIIGKNGSGKSTMLKIIAGIYDPDKGGKVTTKGSIVPFLELGVGFNMELSGRENIYLNGTLLGMTKKFLDEKFEAILDFSGLHEFIDEPVKNYSSGMVLKLAFSIAIQTEADIYILDEILSVGDGLFQQKSKDMIINMTERGKTILFVSHDLGSVSTFCNKVVYIEKGKMKYFGETQTGVNLYKQDLLIEEQEQLKKRKDNLIEIGSKELEIGKVNATLEDDTLQITSEVIYNNDSKKFPFHVDYGIFSENWELIYAFRTSDGDEPFEFGTKEVSARINELNLLPGKYYINVALYKKINSDPMHWKRQAAMFVVPYRKEISKYNYTGFVYYDHEWLR